MRRWFLLLAAFGLTGCRDAGTGDRAVRADTGGTAVVALQSDLDAANIFVSADRYTQEILRYALFLPLVQYDQELGFAPALAESFELSGDTAVTFRLRRDVRWHDGQITSAHDVAFTFERAADTLTAFPNADWLIGWGKPQVIDSFTVRFPLQRMAEPLAGVALLPIMPKHLLESIPPTELKNAPFNSKPVGNGPFKFTQYQPNDRWVFEANPDFPEALGGRPNLSRLVLRIIPDGTAQVAELRAGNVDLALGTSVDQFRALDADTQLVGITRTSPQYTAIIWNAKRPPLNDARVRRALTMALNRTEMIGIARAGQGEVAASPIGSAHWAFDPAVKPVGFSPDSARALLSQAALARPLNIELKVPAQSAAMRSLAEMVKSNFAAIGVQASVLPIDYNTMVGQITDPKRDFDAAIMGWANDIRLNFHDMFHSSAMNGPYQFASYNNPEIDRIIDQAAAEPDRAKARPQWQRFQTIMRDEQPWTVLFHFPDLYIRRERLQGVEMDARGAFVSLPKWWLRKPAAAN